MPTLEEQAKLAAAGVRMPETPTERATLMGGMFATLVGQALDLPPEELALFGIVVRNALGRARCGAFADLLDEGE